MWQKNFVSACFVIVLVSTKDIKSYSRNARLFTFNTVNEDIRVDLDFSIPFISIPVKQTMESTFGPLGVPSININAPALLLGGGVVIATTFLLPLLLKNYAHHPPYNRYAKILENTHFGADAVLDFANKMLTDSQGFQGCALRIACWTGQNEDEDAVRIWSTVMSNQLMSSFINSTAVEEAISSGRRGRECNFYKPCPLNNDHFPKLISKLAQLGNFRR